MNKLVFQTSPAPPLSRLGRMQLLVLMRALQLLVLALVTLVARVGMGIQLPLLPMAGIFALMLAVNLLTWYRSGLSRQGSHTEVFLHLCVDQTGLFLLLLFSGGGANPFVMLLLLPLALGAALLPGRYVIALFIVSVVAYLGLLLVPILPGTGHLVLHGERSSSRIVLSFVRDGHLAGNAYQAHLQGMWVAFVITAGLISAFVYFIAANLRYREGKLRELQMQRLRDEKILALGTQAANAAHELGTPLSTITLLCDELGEEAKDPEVRKLVGEVCEEMQRLRAILQRLAGRAHERTPGPREPEPLRDYLCRVVEDWRALRPGVAPRIQVSDNDAGRKVQPDSTIQDALSNLLNNAADVSPGDLALAGSIHGDWLFLEVLDRGAKSFEQVRRGILAADTSGSGRGMGMGVMLSRAVIERAGGSLAYLPRDGGGLCARITLPLVTMEPMIL